MMDFEAWARELESMVELQPSATNSKDSTSSSNHFRAPSFTSSPQPSPPSSPRGPQSDSPFIMQASSPLATAPLSPCQAQSTSLDSWIPPDADNSKAMILAEAAFNGISTPQQWADNEFDDYDAKDIFTLDDFILNTPGSLLTPHNATPPFPSPSSQAPGSSKRIRQSLDLLMNPMMEECEELRTEKRIDLGLRLGGPDCNSENQTTEFPTDPSALEEARIAAERKRKGKEPMISLMDQTQHTPPEVRPLKLRSFNDGQHQTLSQQTNEFTAAIEALDEGIRKIRRVYSAIHDGLVILPLQPRYLLNLLSPPSSENAQQQERGSGPQELPRPAPADRSDELTARGMEAIDSAGA